MQTFCCHIKILLNYLTKIVSTVFTHLHFFSFFTFLTCLSLLFYTSLPTSIPLCESPSKLSSFTLLYFVTYLHTFMWSLRTVLDLTTALTIIPLCESPSKFAFLYSSILHYLPENFSVNLPQNCPWLSHCTYMHTFVWISLKPSSNIPLLYFITYLHTFVWISLKTVLKVTASLSYVILGLCDSPSKLSLT